MQHGEGGEPATARDLAQHGEHVDLVGDVERAGGLVEQQHIGVSGQHLGEEDELALTAAEFADAPVGEIADPEFAERGLGGSNYGAYSSPAFDAAFIPAMEEMDTPRRLARIEAATRIALDDNALIPLYWETTVWAYKDRYTYAGRVDQATDVDGLSPKQGP